MDSRLCRGPVSTPLIYQECCDEHSNSPGIDRTNNCFIADPMAHVSLRQCAIPQGDRITASAGFMYPMHLQW